MKNFLGLIFILIFGLFECFAVPKDDDDVLLRTTHGVFDIQMNTISRIQFYSTNYGITGYDVSRSRGGTFWPRGSQNQYLFSSGFWFGAKKIDYNRIERNYVTISYNPNSGKGWFCPGRISDKDEVDTTKLYLYRINYSTDFNLLNGESNDYKPGWSLWNKQLQKYPWSLSPDNYEQDSTKRNIDNHQYGPLIISDEDIFATYKDTDLNYYEGGVASSRERGYPLGLQVDQRILTWNENHPLKDCAIIQYLITNKSNDTLFDCHFGGVYDVDIGITSEQATNDRIKYYHSDPTLNLGIGWTNTNLGELGKGYGYIGLSMIETPTIDEQRYLRKDKPLYNPNEQTGLYAFRNWMIQDDPKSDDERYSLISSNRNDGDIGPHDCRMLLSSSAFNLLPNQSVRITYLMAFSMPCKGSEADGTEEDVNCPDGLIPLIRNAIDYYYDLNTLVNDTQIPNSEFIIYPNPVTDFINIKFTSSDNFPNSDRVQIFNTLGVEVASKSLTEQQEYLKIDISHLPTGVYFIRIGNKVEKFVKM